LVVTDDGNELLRLFRIGSSSWLFPFCGFLSSFPSVAVAGGELNGEYRGIERDVTEQEEDEDYRDYRSAIKESGTIVGWVGAKLETIAPNR
jgi:hypothetical protein